MAISGTEVRVIVPDHLYAKLWQESKDTAVTMADLVRIAIKARYPDTSWTDEVLAAKEESE